MDKKVENIITRIEKNEYDAPKLIQIFKNAQQQKWISENDLEVLVSSIESKLREKFPAAGKKIFGAKDSTSRERLQNFYEELSKSIDLSNNKLKNGVKTGGSMINGSQYIYVYISYKNSNKHGVHLCIYQDSHDSELVIRSYKYHKNGDKPSNDHSYSMSEFEIVCDNYKESLVSILE